ncbi:hypothetical protein ACMAZE_07190 [Pseudopelagicola sp. nBUS_20]|uniref:hypothetical protein n=1 Tax=Pseudopelagicola sp. nBUS_20 TaxID=3395317 RepID=UPI003EC0E72F
MTYIIQATMICSNMCRISEFDGNSKMVECSSSENENSRLLEVAFDTVSATGARVSRIEIDGKVYWAKQIEEVKGRSRLFKSSPQCLFDKELAALENLRKRGASVPKLIGRTTSFFLLEDAGRTLHSMWCQTEHDAYGRAHATEQAAITLSAMHHKGIAHGRPVARDICWDGVLIRFVDLENYAPALNCQSGFARDLLLFIHSVLSHPVQDDAAVMTAINAYNQRDTIGVWDHARTMVRRYGWLEVFTRPLQLRKYPHALEFKSLPRLRSLFS